MLTAPRWTHIALPCSDLDASIAWYESFTPLTLLSRREDAQGQAAWLSHPKQVENPFVLVLVMFFRDRGRPQPTMGPFAHIGIEMPERADVDRIAEQGRRAGCLTWEPQQLPPPVGYVCAISDPDGNVVEISYDQGVYSLVQEVWGAS